MRFLYIVILFLSLTGCSSYIVVPKIEVPAELLKECSALVPLPTDTVDPKKVLDNVGINAALYKECADRQRRSITAIKKLTGKE